jgi:UDP-galactopyranose mutase
MPVDLPLVVFSHLRWDFVYQRPQHLLSRLAAKRPVIFIEEPVHNSEVEPRWDLSRPAPGVVVARPNLPIGGLAFNDEQVALLAPMVDSLLAAENITGYVAWFYTPMALPLARALDVQPEAVIFDCMDELSAFRFAPTELIEREAAVMQWADVVFTGGPSLYRARQGRHNNIHCFPSSVDANHFAQAKTVPEAADQAPLPHPRFGFYGVIDERMDLDILDTLARSHPEWQIVIVGPVVKIEPDSLPNHPNLHFLGGRKYEELPSYLAGWDVCLLPFALNEATRFISPTKTLEYMAAGLPIVSTPITDVAEPYGNIAYLGATPEKFVTACERALAASPEERSARDALAREVLRNTSWDTTARSIETLIDNAVKDNRSNRSIGVAAG